MQPLNSHVLNPRRTGQHLAIRMTMSGLPGSTSWWLVLLGVAAAVAAGRLLSIWWRERGPRAIICPENRGPPASRWMRGTPH